MGLGLGQYNVMVLVLVRLTLLSGRCLLALSFLALTAFVVLLFFMSVKNWQAASKTGHAR